MIYPFKRSDYSHAFTAWHLKMLPILNDETLNILNSEVQFILLWSACGSEEKYVHVGVSEFCVEDYPMDNYIAYHNLVLREMARRKMETIADAWHYSWGGDDGRKGFYRKDSDIDYVDINTLITDAIHDNLPIFAELDDACFKSQLEYAKQHKMLREGWEEYMK